MLIATLSLASFALAAEPKPDATIKTKAVEANVFLDAGIKADPPLAADSLADGKTWLDKNAADAASELKQDPQFFKDGGWAFERKYAVQLGRGRSAMSWSSGPTTWTAHGAHPNSDINTILWDKSEQPAHQHPPVL